MKKRNLLAVLLLVCLALGCFGTGSAEEELSGTIEFWSFLTQEERATELDNIARAYEAANPGVKVNITVMPWSGALDSLVAAVIAGNAPDMFITGTGYPQTLAGTGGLLELSGLVDEIGGADSFLSTSLTVQGASEDGGIYSIPIYVTPYVAYYRQSWLDEAGVTGLPTTWEEYYDMCLAVTDRRRAAMASRSRWAICTAGRPSGASCRPMMWTSSIATRTASGSSIWTRPRAPRPSKPTNISTSW